MLHEFILFPFHHHQSTRVCGGGGEGNAKTHKTSFPYWNMIRRSSDFSFSQPSIPSEDCDLSLVRDFFPSHRLDESQNTYTQAHSKLLIASHSLFLQHPSIHLGLYFSSFCNRGVASSCKQRVCFQNRVLIGFHELWFFDKLQFLSIAREDNRF